MTTKTKITRETLYKRVWSQPMVQLAKEYKVSDVALAKICDKLNVPRPPRGYWSKLAAGHKVNKAKLPLLEEGSKNEATINPPKVYIYSLTAEKREELKSYSVPIPDNLNGCDALVTRTRKVFEASKVKDDIIDNRAPNTLKVNISKPVLRRTLLICEAIIKESTKRGWSVVSDPTTSAFIIQIDDDPVSLCIKEKFAWEDVEGGDKEYKPSGMLSIYLADRYWCYGEGLRTTWNDGKIQRLEDVLVNLILTLELHSQKKRARRLEQEKWRRQRDEAERQRKLHAARVEKEKCYREKLRKMLTSYRVSQSLHDFMSLAEARFSTNPNAERYLSWITQLADQKDPFLNGELESAMKDQGHDATLVCTDYEPIY